MKSKFTSTQALVATIILLICATSTRSQNLQHDWTETATGSITNLQNMTVVANGDRYVAEDTEGDGFSVAKYNDDGHLVWRTPYPLAPLSAYVPLAVAYNAGAIFVLCDVLNSTGAVVKFSGDRGLQFPHEGTWGGGFIHRSGGIIADPLGAGVIVTKVIRYTDDFYFGHRQHRMNTMKYDGDLNQVWPHWVGQSLGELFIDGSQDPTPKPRMITAGSDGSIYITGVLEVQRGSAMPPYRTSPARAFTLKYNSMGSLDGEIWQSAAEPAFTNFGYNNDYDATGTYMVYQRAPLHLVDGPLPTGMTVLTKRNLDGTTWEHRRPSRTRDLRVPDTGTSVHPNVLAVDRSTSSAYIAYDEVSASSVALEKYDETGAMLWLQRISIGAATNVESVVLDIYGNVVVGVNNDILGKYGIFVFGPNGNFIDKIEVTDKQLKQLLVDDHNHIHTIGTISGSTTSYFVSRFSRTLAIGFSSTPELLRPVGNFDFDLFGNGLDECWTGLLVNWNCLVPPYCIDPVMSASLLFQGKTMWEANFFKPFETSIPKSEDFRTFSLRVKDKMGYKQVLQVDDKLTKNGVTQLSLKTNSIDQSVDLSIATDGALVPIAISLLNGEGKVLWKEQFTAPFQKQLTERFNEPVASILINGPEDQISVTYYPNPSNGAFTVELDPKQSLPLELAVYDMQGFRVHQQMLKESKVPINLSTQKPGLYVLTLKNGFDEIKEVIQIK
ncbi:MAG TPA: T9SS type A sorting domain-containing protein [Chryseolinea sp.]